MLTDTERPTCYEERIHGVAVRDPFRWLEDGSASETRKWVFEQSQRYDDYCATAEHLGFFRDRVRRYLDVETVDQPVKVAGKYFYRKRSFGAEQACIYMRDASRSEERLLVDPASEGRFASVGIHRISPSGRLLAYELKQGGSDLVSIRIVNVESGEELQDSVPEGYLRGFVFDDNDENFYYCRETREAVGDHAIRLHRLGSRAMDPVVVRFPRTAGSRLTLTSDRVHLGAMLTHKGGGEHVTTLSLARHDQPNHWNAVSLELGGECKPFLAGGRIFALDFSGTPKGMLLELQANGLDRGVIIPEPAEAIQHLSVVDNSVVFTSVRGWGTAAFHWRLSGEFVGSLAFPHDGTIRLLQRPDSEALFCSYESFSERLVTFEFQPSSGHLETWHRQVSPVATSVQSAGSVVTTKDGTKVPLLIVAKDFETLSNDTAAIMTGYGGFGTSVCPQYSILVSIMLELGAKFAVARIRGGGEYGRDWHDAGRRLLRQNAFDDFVDAAEWLCSEGLTAPDKLAIFGGSNGGLLMGAALTQRPDLFQAVLCIAPLLDMVRYESFDRASRWTQEYGSAEIADEFKALLSYSPYHHVAENVNYPSVLFISGDMDDRCNPAHVRKMTAELQRRPAQKRPILVDYLYERGHSPVLPLSVRVESLARRISFLCRELGISPTGRHA